MGDLGNIVAGGVGEVVHSFTDSLVTLYGTRSVIGRAIVVSHLLIFLYFFI